MYIRFLVSVFFLTLGHVSAFGQEESLCKKCHGGQPAEIVEQENLAPLLPEAFTMRWNMYEFELTESLRPPLAEIPEERELLRGVTHFDSASKSMTEIYYDKCIDIFPEGRDYPCQFLSVGAVTYLIRFTEDMQIRDCRLWSDEAFYAPRRDVVRHMKFEKALTHGNQSVRWWWLDKPLPGPFGFGFKGNTDEPYAFWFPIINGWVQQEFYAVQRARPDVSVFTVPEQCL